MIYLELFLNFLKIGAFTFGGGYAMIPMMQETILSHKWLTEAQIINFIAVSESTPGPFAVNMATYVGTEIAGIYGAICATLGVVLPSFVIILIVAGCYLAFKENRYVKGCMTGLRPTVVALIASAVLSVGTTVFFNEGFTLNVLGDISFYISLVISVSAFFLLRKKINPIIIICLAALVGICTGYIFTLPV